MVFLVDGEEEGSDSKQPFCAIGGSGFQGILGESRKRLLYFVSIYEWWFRIGTRVCLCWGLGREEWWLGEGRELKVSVFLVVFEESYLWIVRLVLAAL